ncbi:hypothetical protein GCM10025865_33780 (plasmid) [Paraoerskovia sediminicola]|uniref:NIPSNAP protein n=1 Tax=Paraoerskovia sediminicola TaxID=1138587 RepID=A0ABN6XGW2_9CELL|nr:hypothetical protein [Paraoerskovia sediminicola]BDZ44035.1 hypothetical protein GCM10025865_33340 [Paraoerskovia sediminicola]BDZ44079.1 hypothetical protein GCM10025865_33780 [Paraoerskovia sediminicola]
MIDSHPDAMPAERRAILRDKCAKRLPQFQAHYVDELADGLESYALWLGLLDLRLKHRAFVGHESLADRDWYGAYEAGQDPIAYADAVLSHEFPQF